MIYTELPKDQENIDPKDLAVRLKQAFQEYYESKKIVIDRRKLDIAALKKRANIEENTIPSVVRNIVGKLYNA